MAITSIGQADYAITLPMNLGLVAFAFHAQALMLYTGGSVAASHGITGVVCY